MAFDAFEPVMSDSVRNELIRLGDRHYNYLYQIGSNSLSPGDNTFWYSGPHGNNWNAVINGGGLGTASISLLGHNRYATDWLRLAVQTQEYFLENNFDGGGAYSESLMYNGYALGTAAIF